MQPPMPRRPLAAVPPVRKVGSVEEFRKEFKHAPVPSVSLELWSLSLEKGCLKAGFNYLWRAMTLTNCSISKRQALTPWRDPSYRILFQYQHTPKDLSSNIQALLYYIRKRDETYQQVLRHPPILRVLATLAKVMLTATSTGRAWQRSPWKCNRQ